jgi:hypothetical protein
MRYMGGRSVLKMQAGAADKMGVNLDRGMARLVGGLFIFLGGLIAIAGMFWLARTRSFVMGAVKTPGVVIAMERRESSEGGATFTPVFTFTDGVGLVHTQRSSFGSSTFSFEPGEKVTVLYDPATPKRSNIDSFQTVWLGPLFIAGFGLLFGGFACVWLMIASRAIARRERFEAEGAER